MYLPDQNTTQVYSLFGTYVVEQHDRGFDQGRRFDVPEPALFEPPPSAPTDPPKAA